MFDPSGAHILVTQTQDWGLFASPFVGQSGTAKVIPTSHTQEALKAAWRFVRQFDGSATVRKQAIVTKSGAFQLFPVGTTVGIPGPQRTTDPFLVIWKGQDMIWTERNLPVVVYANSIVEALNGFALSIQFVGRFPKWEKGTFCEYKISPLHRFEIETLPLEVIS